LGKQKPQADFFLWARAEEDDAKQVEQGSVLRKLVVVFVVVH